MCPEKIKLIVAMYLVKIKSYSRVCNYLPGIMSQHYIIPRVGWNSRLCFRSIEQEDQAYWRFVL